MRKGYVLDNQIDIKMLLDKLPNSDKKLDKNKSWVDVKNKVLISREIKIRQYYSICNTINSETGKREYLIATADIKPEDRDMNVLKKDNYNRVKISLFGIWDYTKLSELSINSNITLSHVEGDDTCDIYKLHV